MKCPQKVFCIPKKVLNVHVSLSALVPTNKDKWNYNYQQDMKEHTHSVFHSVYAPNPNFPTTCRFWFTKTFMVAILVSLETTLESFSMFYKNKAKSSAFFFLEPGCGLWRYWWQSCFDGQPLHQVFFLYFFSLDGLILMMVWACFAIKLSL